MIADGDYSRSNSTLALANHIQSDSTGNGNADMLKLEEMGRATSSCQLCLRSTQHQWHCHRQFRVLFLSAKCLRCGTRMLSTERAGPIARSSFRSGSTFLPRGTHV